MTPQEVESADDMRRLVEERGAKNITIAMSDMHGLLRGKYISRDKLLSVLENGWGMPPLILALDFDDAIFAVAYVTETLATTIAILDQHHLRGSR